jgi:transcriptional regulator with PAS, ATPase and Fis domain
MSITVFERQEIISKYEIVQRALQDNAYNKTRTAAALGISRRTINNIINRYKENIQKKAA